MLNIVVVCGRLTKDPTLGRTQSGKDVVSFSIACDRDRSEGTDFVDCVAWDKTAQFLDKYFRKGQMVVVCGRLTQNKWEQDGVNRSKLEVMADRVYFGERKNDRSQVD